MVSSLASLVQASTDNSSQCWYPLYTRLLRLHSSTPAMGQAYRRFCRRWYPSSIRCRGVCYPYKPWPRLTDNQIRCRILPINPRRQAGSRASQAGRIQAIHADQGSRSTTSGRWRSSWSFQPCRPIYRWLLQLQALEPPMGPKCRFGSHCWSARSKWIGGVSLFLFVDGPC